MKETMPQPQEQMEEGGYDREAIAVAAAETAQKMIAERIDAEVQSEERFTEMQSLMQELAEDNGNRFIVEAIAQRLSLEKKALELQDLEAHYPLAA